MFLGTLFAFSFSLYGSHIVGPPPPPSNVSEFYVNWYPIPVVNTIVLFSSAFTCHFAADSLADDNRRRFYFLWTATILLGLAFEFGQLYEFIAAFGTAVILAANAFSAASFLMT